MNFCARLQLLASGFLVFLASCSSSPKELSALQKPTPESKKIVLLFASDLHGRLLGDGSDGGYAKIAHILGEERKKADPNTDVVFIVGGDIMGKGAIPCRKTEDRSCVPFLKDLGVDFAVLGNNELKRSSKNLNDLIRRSGVTWVGGNVHTPGGAEKLWKSFAVYHGDRSGLSFALHSWTFDPGPAERPARPGFMVKKSWSPGDFNKMLKESQGLPVVWANHLELKEDLRFIKNLCQGNFKNLVYLKSNDHVQSQRSSECLPFFQPGPYGQSLSRLLLYKNKSGDLVVAEHRFIAVDASVPAEPTLLSKIRAIYKKHAPRADRVVTHVPSKLEQSDVGQLLASYYRKLTKADVGIVNSGAIKSSLKPGPLSWEQVLFTVPYNNKVMGLDWSVADMEKALCRASKRKKKLYLDDGSDLYMVGATLVFPGTENCRLKLEHPRSRIKVAIDSYLIKRSERWLGTELKTRAFPYGLNTERSLELGLKKFGVRL